MYFEEILDNVQCGMICHLICPNNLTSQDSISENNKSSIDLGNLLSIYDNDQSTTSQIYGDKWWFIKEAKINF